MLEQKECVPLLDIETVMPILKHISIFAGLSGNQLLDLFKRLEKVSYGAGERIFEQGTEPDHIYIIKSGRVQLSVSKGDTVLELAEFDCGQCLGEASIIGIRPHSATAVAVEDCELIVLAGIAHRLQRVIDDRKRTGRELPSAEELRHISPAQFGVVNFKGRYHFPVHDFAAQLLSPAA